MINFSGGRRPRVGVITCTLPGPNRNAYANLPRKYRPLMNANASPSDSVPSASRLANARSEPSRRR